MEPDSSMITGGGSVFTNVALLVVLIMCNAFFAMSEIALISLNDNKVKKMAQEGDKRAKILARLTAEPSRFLATIQVGVTLSGFLASAVAADTFAEYVVHAFAGIAIPATTVRTISIFVITLLLSYVTLVFGELVPKRVAMQNAERVSFSIARIIAFVSWIGKPFVGLLSASTNGVLRLMGIDPHQKPEEVTEEEIRMMIDVGGESGTIEQSEKDMINNIFEFDDRTAEEMMTHRTEISAVEIGTSLEEITALALESGYSRIPVYEDDLDSIIGILYVKDLLALVTGQVQGEFDLRQYMREPLYVLESTSCKTLLSEFKLKKIQMAIVVDEYGGTSGLVSMEDLLESIVGNIQDEYDDEEEDISDLGDGSYLIDGLAPLEEVLKLFGLDLDDADEYDTIGGYIINELGYIPADNAFPAVELEGIRFTVQEMDERRIAKLLAQLSSAGDAPGEQRQDGA